MIFPTHGSATCALVWFSAGHLNSIGEAAQPARIGVHGVDQSVGGNVKMDTPKEMMAPEMGY